MAEFTEQPPPALPASERASLRQELMHAVPFSQMAPALVDQFVAAARAVSFAPEEVVLEPGRGPVRSLLYVRSGSITGRRGMAEMAGPFEYGSGDLFPVGAALGGRAVTATYTANEATRCLEVPLPAVHALVAASPQFADFLQHRVMHYLDLSRRAVQATWASLAQGEPSLDARLSSLPPVQALACTAATPLAQALVTMHERGVGSVLVLDDDGSLRGILTRHDILGRVTLPQRPLDTPIGDVMTTPVHALTVEHTLHDAALLMSRQGIRHVPVVDAGRVINIVSERDLFALQRLSIKQLSTQIRGAADLAVLRHLAGQIRRFAGNLLGQGVQARQLTELISHLNDLLTSRILHLVAERRGMNLAQACWLAFGSEGRGEQTVATDQDNGIVFESAAPDVDRPRWLALAREVNDALDACGYPLCKGQVMASNPASCLSAAEWLHRFGHWIEHGAPVDLLNASIYFDLRPLCGRMELAQPLRDTLVREAVRVPRFLRQLAENALRTRVPLNWRGALETTEVEGKGTLDLKLQGTAIFVDAARLFALAHGLPAVGTRARLEAAAPRMRVALQESQAWIAGFEFLQMLRLQVQIRGDAPPRSPNLIEIDRLNDIDRHVLKETMRIARRLQQRIVLDYMR